MKVNEKRDEMAEAHRRDYEDKDAMRALRFTILDFLEKPPSRCAPRTQATLLTAIGMLSEDEARIVSAWD